ncbi:arylesterase [Phenylobacterium soli]|uniref:Arylesterase n=1 Tax=Phenylobacterium soli TaxID=2170551 RepID=A0A328ASD0_9CAUL|nr:arylesterase [Phenylobacterium soli]RAK55828.1 arylesterase [Phenylobacterium soli]
MADTRTPLLSRRALVGGALAALPLARPAAALAARGPVITILGDSITAGLGLPARDALPNQLHLALEKLGLPNQVRGAGVSGDTTAGGLARVNFSVRPDSGVVVVALGGNDLLQGIDPKATRANLDQIIRRLKTRHKAVVLAGISAPAEIGRGYASEFNAMFPGLARSHGVALYPDLLAGVERNPALNQGDGIHPNARGVQIIAARLAPVVAKAARRAA